MNSKFKEMKNKIILLTIMLSITSLLSFSACTIQGEEICGIWNAKSNYGNMQIEITPWKGQFFGYLLEYQNGNETIQGAKTEDFIFITDLVFKDGQYKDGKIYSDANSEESCGLVLELSNENELTAIYNCQGSTYEEVWYRSGYNPPVKTVANVKPKKVENKRRVEEPVNKVTASKKVITDAKKRNTEKVVSKNNEKSNSVSNNTEIEIGEETHKQATFYIVGIQQLVKYDDLKKMGEVIESMWTDVFKNDFSNKLSNITEENNMYLSYSNYDNPKGKMTITLGYKVKSLSAIPNVLKGIEIPTNEYWVHPILGNQSDYEGEAWEQTVELMMYRKENSADFEVYTFDSNYEIEKAAMWVAVE